MMEKRFYGWVFRHLPTFALWAALERMQVLVTGYLASYGNPLGTFKPVNELTVMEFEYIFLDILSKERKEKREGK